MSQTLLRILGVDTSGAADGVATDFQWSHGPRSWGVFVLLAIAIALVYGATALYRREIHSCPRGIKRLLGVIRALTLIVLLVVLLGPSLAVTQQRSIQPQVLLLLDDSSSMSIRDAYENEELRTKIAAAAGRDAGTLAASPVSRAELVDSILNREQNRWLKELALRGRVRVATFSNVVRVRDTQAARGDAGDDPASRPSATQPVPPLAANGPGTNLSKALREALRLSSGNPVAGIVVLTDGQHNEGDDPLAAADAAAQQGVPVMVLGVGDPAEPRNLRVAEVSAPESVFRADPFIIRASIEATGMGDAPLAVELLQRSADATSDAANKVIATQNVRLVNGRGSVSFEHTPQDAGQFVFTVRVPVQQGEQETSDNIRPLPVKVLSEQVKVLLVSGAPTWEYQFVRTLFKRDKTIDVSCWLQSLDDGMRQDGDTVINKLPGTLEELLKYDVVVLLDPNPVEFDETRIKMLQAFVSDHGGGLMWQTGAKFTHRFFSMPSTRGITDILPMRLGTESAKTEPLDLTQTREWATRITAAGVDHALMRLHRDPQVSRALFQSLPGIYWSYPSLDHKPGALTLLEHTDPRLSNQGKNRPLLIAGQYSRGRTVYMGFDGTWRWRRTGEKQFDSFWVQTIRYLVEGRLLGGQHRGRIGTDRDTYGVGDRVLITANLLGPDYKALKQGAVQATIKTAAGSATVELKPVSGREGQYEGSIVAAQLGNAEVAVTLADDPSGKPVRIAKLVTVELPRVEFADTRLNKTLLSEIATRSGGKYFEIDEAPAIPKALPDRRETVSVRGKPIELWDTNRLLFLLAGLMCAEWATRKYFKLL